MIVLITGASHTGKTALAQKLLEKYKYPYLSIDHLKMGLIRSGNTELTPMDDHELTEYLWPIVREMIKTAIENKQNLIVEGGYIPFDWSKDFEQECLEHIQYYCLVMSENYIRNHFADIKKYAQIAIASCNSFQNSNNFGRTHRDERGRAKPDRENPYAEPRRGARLRGFKRRRYGQAAHQRETRALHSPGFSSASC